MKRIDVRNLSELSGKHKITKYIIYFTILAES